jgi:hypothetical protein
MPEPDRTRDPHIRALKQELTQASNPQVMRIVATVDALMSRGAADDLVAPLRQRLIGLRPPRPLRFARLLFHPLNPLIVPPTRWRLGHLTIPRTALGPIAEQVHRTMGEAGIAMDAAVNGHTDAETDLIVSLGQSLWPEAARILAEPAIPASWETTHLGDATYRQLADTVSTLLDQSVALEATSASTANGLMGLRAENIGHILSQVADKHAEVLPMMITLVLVRLPQAAAMLAAFQPGAAGTALHAATNQAAELLLRQLDEANGVEIKIATGSLADSGSAVKDIVTLLQSLETANPGSGRRERLRAILGRLDTGCKERFAAGLQNDLLMPLGRMTGLPNAAAISTLETVARSLRVLETEGRKAGGGITYDLLLKKAVAAIEAGTVKDLLTPIDQARLVEILAGPDAALALLGSRP